MRYGIIYITTNNVNGKKYVGQTKRVDPRYLGSGKAIKKAIKKYGKRAFTREIIAEASSKKELDKLEEAFIAKFDAANSRNWYNIQSVPHVNSGFKGKTHTAERNRKLSEKFKGHKVSDKVRKNAASLGKKQKGSKNGRAIKVDIFDANGTLMATCNGNFKEVCLENNWPLALASSYRSSGKPIFSNGRSLSNLADRTMLKYKGWFAIKYPQP